MSEIITSNEVVTEEATQQQETVATESTQLQATFWGDTPPAAQPEVKNELPKAEEKKEEVQQPVVNEWYKQFEWDNEETAKAEIQKLKQTPQPEEIKFANDLSKQVHELLREGKVDEVMDIYSKQKQLDKVISGNVTPDNAEDIIKLQMKMKFPKLTDAQIDFQFNEDYGVGKKPTMKESELEEEYNERLQEWNDKVARVNMKKEIAATMAIPELQKHKEEIVFPDIKTLNPNSQSQRQPTQEELAADKKMKEDWTKAATAMAAQFKGLSTTAKYKDGDKEVEIPVSYGLSPEEVKTLNTKLSAFAESNFDPYTILKERWVDEKGNDKLDQMVEDLSWLMFGKTASQKFANEAAHQRLENYLKEKKNIRIDSGGGKDFGASEQQKTQSEQLQEAFWGN